jgi:hypothetical protein
MKYGRQIGARVIAIGGVLLAGLIATAGPAGARSLGAFAGAPLDGSQSACFTEFAGGVVGTNVLGCAGNPLASSPRWEVNLPIDTTGPKSVMVGIRGVSVGCGLISANQASGVFSSSAQAFGFSPSILSIPTLTVNVPTNGSLLLACDHMANPGAFITNINWNP